MKWLNGLSVLLFSGLLVCSFSSPCAGGSLYPASGRWMNGETSLPSNAWSKGDTIRESAWQVIHALDFLQTRKIAKHPELYYERNPLLGDHPSEEKVMCYFALGAVAHSVISFYLPRDYRAAWQYVTIMFSGGVVVTNFFAGLSITW